MYTDKNRPLPHLRLRKLRKMVNGLTQDGLARRCGVSRFTIRSIEDGQRRLTTPMATRISRATGVSLAWLMGDGDDSQPLNELHEPYSPQDYINRRRVILLDSIDPDGDVSGRIHELAHELTTLLRAAYRKGQLGNAVFLFREMVKEITESLGFKGATEPELAELERFVFGHAGPHKTREETDPGAIDILWRLLSPTGVIKWATAFRGTTEERDYFLEEIDDLRDFVSKSFILTAPKT